MLSLDTILSNQEKTESGMSNLFLDTIIYSKSMMNSNFLTLLM